MWCLFSYQSFCFVLLLCQLLVIATVAQKQNITTKNIQPDNKDASDMGFREVNKKLKNSKETDFSDIISQKLKGI